MTICFENETFVDVSEANHRRPCDGVIRTCGIYTSSFEINPSVSREYEMSKSINLISQ